MAHTPGSTTESQPTATVRAKLHNCDIMRRGEANKRIAEAVAAGGFEVAGGGFELGEVSFHSGWTFHRSGRVTALLLLGAALRTVRDKRLGLGVCLPAAGARWPAAQRGGVCQRHHCQARGPGVVQFYSLSLPGLLPTTTLKSTYSLQRTACVSARFRQGGRQYQRPVAQGDDRDLHGQRHGACGDKRWSVRCMLPRPTWGPAESGLNLFKFEFVQICR